MEPFSMFNQKEVVYATILYFLFGAFVNRGQIHMSDQCFRKLIKALSAIDGGADEQGGLSQ